MKHQIYAVLAACLLIGFINVNANEGTAETSTETTSDEQRIEIRIDKGDIGEAKQEIHDAMSELRELFGDDLGDEIEKELDKLSDEEKHQLRNKFKGKTFRFGDGDGGLDFPEALIAIVAITFSLGMPIIILLMVLFYSNRKRRQKMELVQSYLNSNQEVPDHVMSEFVDGKADPLRSGITLVAVGLGVVLALGISGGLEVGAFGLIPLFIGLSRLVYWRMDQQRDQA